MYRSHRFSVRRTAASSVGGTGRVIVMRQAALAIAMPLMIGAIHFALIA